MNETFSPEKCFAKNLFIGNKIEDFPFDKILSSLVEDKFACLRGLIQPEKARQAKIALSKRFSKANDHPTIGESPKDVQQNFQKFAIGGARGNHHIGSYARLLRIFYNPLWQEDIYQMHDIFRQLVGVRNTLMGKPVGFACDTIDNNLWTAARIHQYPTGGGFIQAHKDSTQELVANKGEINYFQVFTFLSKKGEDFERGGGYVVHDRNRITLDDYCGYGDIAIYDGSTLHGVADIDPHKLLDLDTVSGRLSAFVSLYSVMPA